MIYALVHFPNIDARHIDQLRRKYDPQVELIEPHITFMFPISAVIGTDPVVYHLGNVLNRWKSFPIHLRGLQISSDDHLFLLLEEGHANVVRLHDEIYTGRLADHHRKDIPYVPHLTLGVLPRDSNQQERVLAEAKQLGMDYHCVLDRLTLVKINDARSKIVWNKEFRLVE
jgi:2'-5' RNA ligase